MKGGYEAFRFSSHTIRELLRRISGEPVDASVYFREVEVPAFVRRTTVAGRLGRNDENTLAGDISEVIVNYPATVRDHLVDDHASQVADSNTGK